MPPARRQGRCRRTERLHRVGFIAQDLDRGLGQELAQPRHGDLQHCHVAEIAQQIVAWLYEDMHERRAGEVAISRTYGAEICSSCSRVNTPPALNSAAGGPCSTTRPFSTTTT